MKTLGIFVSRTSVLLMMTLLVACVNRPVSYNDMLAISHNKDAEVTFEGPIFINKVKTPEPEKFRHFEWALSNSLKSHKIRVSKEKSDSYILDVEMTRHELVLDTPNEDIYETNINYRVTKPDGVSIIIDEVLKSKFSSDQMLYDVEKIKSMSNDENAGIVGEVIMVGVIGAFGINVAPSGFSRRPASDTINIAEEDAIGNVIQANFRAFIERIQGFEN